MSSQMLPVTTRNRIVMSMLGAMCLIAAPAAAQSGPAAHARPAEPSQSAPVRERFIHVPSVQPGQGGYTISVPEDSPLWGKPVPAVPTTPKAPPPIPPSVTEGADHTLLPHLTLSQERSLLGEPDIYSEEPLLFAQYRDSRRYAMTYLSSDQKARYDDLAVRSIRSTLLDVVLLDEARTRVCNIMVDGAYRSGLNPRQTGSDCLGPGKLYRGFVCSTLRAHEMPIRRLFTLLGTLFKDKRLALTDADLADWRSTRACGSSLDATYPPQFERHHWRYLSEFIAEVGQDDTIRAAMVAAMKDGRIAEPVPGWRGPLPGSRWEDYTMQLSWSCSKPGRAKVDIIAAIHCAAVKMKAEQPPG